MATGSPAADPALEGGHDHAWRRLWRYGRALVAPVLIWLLLGAMLL